MKIAKLETFSTRLRGFDQEEVFQETPWDTYTTMLVINYSCRGGSDTLRQVINITQPCFTFSSSGVSCASAGTALTTIRTSRKRVRFMAGTIRDGFWFFKVNSPR